MQDYEPVFIPPEGFSASLPPPSPPGLFSHLPPSTADHKPQPLNALNRTPLSWKWTRALTLLIFSAYAG